MSRRTRFLASLTAVVARLGGSHLTREARERTATRFARVMWEAGFTHLRSPADIAGRQLRVYVAARAGRAGARTLHNELAHLRTILRASGRAATAQAPELSNTALGIPSGSRVGAKTAMTDDELQAATALAHGHGRPGFAALLSLERYLGLRGAEAIHARLDTLERWQRELATDGRVNVVAGTKGGRPRIVAVRRVEPALDAVIEALGVVRAQGGYLVVRACGAPAGGLKQARSIYHAWCHRAGIQPHSARYAFARDQLAGYLAAGFSSREALIAVSHDLGHGDGRGRWVKSVYMR
jgi:hypothetical protein